MPKRARGQRTFELVERAGNEPEDHRLLLHADLADRLPARLGARPGPRRRAEARRDGGDRAGTDPSDAIVDELLSLTVCDPACGSGHFLVAAARRIAKRVAAVRERNPEPTVEAVRHALREVVAHCIYGVDINPMAVELAKVSLWLEALEPGKPLSFLDAHIKCGNALIGATPALIDDGIPDEAFKPIEGDDTKYAASLKRANAAQPVLTAGQRRVARFSAPPTLPGLEPQRIKRSCSATRSSSPSPTKPWRQRLARIAHAPDGSLREVHGQAAAYRKWSNPTEHRRKHQIADAWCAAFVWHQEGGRATRDREPRLPAQLQEQGSSGDSAGDTHGDRTRSGASTASSTGTWSSPISSTCPTAIP